MNLVSTPEGINYILTRTRTEKWAKILFYVGHALILVNLVSVLMTCLKLTGIINEHNPEEQKFLSSDPPEDYL